MSRALRVFCAATLWAVMAAGPPTTDSASKAMSLPYVRQLPSGRWDMVVELPPTVRPLFTRDALPPEIRIGDQILECPPRAGDSTYATVRGTVAREPRAGERISLREQQNPHAAAIAESDALNATDMDRAKRAELPAPYAAPVTRPATKPASREGT